MSPEMASAINVAIFFNIVSLIAILLLFLAVVVTSNQQDARIARLKVRMIELEQGRSDEVAEVRRAISNTYRYTEAVDEATGGRGHYVLLSRMCGASESPVQPEGD